MPSDPCHADVRPTRTAPRCAPLTAAPALGLILLVSASAGCTTAVPRGMRQVNTAELQNIPTVVTAPAAAKAAAATNATPTTRARPKMNNE